MTKASVDNTFSAQDKIGLGLTPDAAGTTNASSVVGYDLPASRRDREPPRATGSAVGDAVSRRDGEPPHSADNVIDAVAVSREDWEPGQRAANVAERVEMGSVASPRSECMEARSGDANACLGKASVTSVDFAAITLEKQEEAVVAAEAGRETPCIDTDAVNGRRAEGSPCNKNISSSSSSRSSSNNHNRAGAHSRDIEGGVGSGEVSGSNSSDITKSSSGAVASTGNGSALIED